MANSALKGECLKMSYIWDISTVLLHSEQFLTALHYINKPLNLFFKFFIGCFLEKERILLSLIHSEVSGVFSISSQVLAIDYIYIWMYVWTGSSKGIQFLLGLLRPAHKLKLEAKTRFVQSKWIFSSSHILVIDQGFFHSRGIKDSPLPRLSGCGNIWGFIFSIALVPFTLICYILGIFILTADSRIKQNILQLFLLLRILYQKHTMRHTAEITKTFIFASIIFLPFFPSYSMFTNKSYSKKISDAVLNAKVHRVLRTYQVNVNSYCIKAFNLI